MNSKTIIIDNNNISLNKLALYMQKQMPQLNLIGSFNTIQAGLKLINKEKPKLVFVNIQHLDAETFLQLQQMRTAACSIIFINPEQMEENLKHLPKQLMHTKTQKKQSLSLKIEGATQLVKFEQIIRLEAQSSYTLIYLKDKPQPVLTSKTLKYYANQFDEKQFIRPHQSHLVNTNFIENIITKNNKYLLLKDGTRIKMSRRKARELQSLD